MQWIFYVTIIIYIIKLNLKKLFIYGLLLGGHYFEVIQSLVPYTVFV